MAQNANFTLELTTPFDDSRPIYVSGSFCDWLPNRAEFKMKKVNVGHYVFEFPKNFKVNNSTEYKYTRGGWGQVELDQYGNSPLNRFIDNQTKTKQDYVPFWRINGKNFDENLMPIVQTIQDFEIPQLKKKRNIHVLLPSDYHLTDQRYPVIYMQDAQNLFGEGSAYGNWAIDQKLAVLKARNKGDVIVVAINHGEENRFDEYSPYKNAKSVGLGKKYASFIAKTLKPYIDANFKTKPEREFTGVGGSSMGGLVSIYAGLMYPEILGRLMIFSPSFWVSPKIYFDAIEFFQPIDTKIYLYAGNNEGQFMVENVQKFKETLENQGFKKQTLDFKVSIDEAGKHSESAWSKEFPAAIEWLFE